MDALPAEIEVARKSPEWARTKKLLSDRDWRLDNLYWIKNDRGERIRFVRNEAQRAFMGSSALRNVLPKARKLGFSTLIAMLILDRCMFRSGNAAGIIDQTLIDAIDKLEIIRLGYVSLPADLREANPLVRDNEELLEWANGSTVSVGTSYRGGTPQDLHVSEFGKISADNPDAANEILTGAIQAVPATGRVWVESTAHGTSGKFAEMVRRAEAMAISKAPLTALDFKFNFFGWWIKREYRLPNNLVIVPAELKQYFAEIEGKIGRRIDADQRAWYAKKFEELGPTDIKQEFPSTADELFFVSLEGSFWREELNKARREKRIGFPVSYDPSRPVNTMWDIGEDCTAIIFHQSDGVRHRFIDYWEEVGSSLQKSCGIVHQKRDERGFIYAKHWGPHDLNNKDWGNSGKTRKEVAEGLGVKFDVVPRIDDKADSIEAARRMLNTAYVDAEHCSLLVDRWENYRKRWNKQLSVFTADPVHDMPSHGSDALQQGAMGFSPEKLPKDEDKHRRRDKPKRSAWAQ